MFDIFYVGSKPNLFAHEQQADSLEDAARKCRTRLFWWIDGGNDYTGFDFSWEPVPWEWDHIHVFPSQHRRNGGVYLANPKHIAEQQWHFHTDQRVVRLPQPERWQLNGNEIDMSWHPDEIEGCWNFEFGTQLHDYGGPIYITPGATFAIFCNEIRATRLPGAKVDMTNWVVPDYVNEFDFSWRPPSWDPPFIYKFDTVWHQVAGPEYHVPGATQEKYMTNLVATTKVDMTHWVVPDNVAGFDFSWMPPQYDPPLIYQFGTQWQHDGGPQYIVPGATEVKYVDDIRVTMANNLLPRYYIETTLDALVAEHPTEIFWALDKDMEYGDFDFSWHPNSSQSDFVHVFGSQWQRHSETYLVNGPSYTTGNKEFNYVDDIKVKSSSNLDIFFVDKGNARATDRFSRLQERYPHIQRTRFFNGWMETLQRCGSKSKTEKFWAISSDLIYDEFDFDWHAEPWQSNMLHVFGSKWQKWSDTFLFNKREVGRIAKWCKDIKEAPSLNFVQDQKVVIADDVNEIYFVDLNNDDAPKSSESVKRQKANTVRYFDSYLETLRRIVNTAEGKEWIWVASSACDYSKFDFSWQPEPWQATMLHVFPSNSQVFGDTFYVHVPSFKEKAKGIATLNDYPDLNYVADQSANRMPIPTVHYTTDSVVDAIKGHYFESLYAVFAHAGSPKVPDYEPMCLWSADTKVVRPLSRGGGIVVVPCEAKWIDDQVYDYKHIAVNPNKIPDHRQDVVFISNGEPNADENWEHLKKLVPYAKRVDGVNGRSQAYKAAAKASDTPWMFTVFAKLRMNEDFDWNWQPDRMQEAKHYIFYAKNPVNNLEYGHMGLIVYNKAITLATKQQEVELDFTLAAPHEVVPITSGVANFNTDPYNTWRAAFREVVKLKHFTSLGPDRDAAMRLAAWQNIANDVPFAQWAVTGAIDALEFYDKANGQLQELKKSYEWSWLEDLWHRKNHALP